MQVTGRTLYLAHAPAEQVNRKLQVDVALVTRDPKTGELLTGACYIILDASIEGCDENDDGQVDYEGVVPGTYTIHQTKSAGRIGSDQRLRGPDLRVRSGAIDPDQAVRGSVRARFRNVSVAIYDVDTADSA